jgi:hypothetical protein
MANGVAWDILLSHTWSSNMYRNGMLVLAKLVVVKSAQGVVVRPG